MDNAINNDIRINQAQLSKGLQRNNSSINLNCKPDEVCFTTDKQNNEVKPNNTWKLILGIGSAALAGVGLFLALRRGKTSLKQEAGQTIGENVRNKFANSIEEKIAHRDTLIGKEEIIDETKIIISQLAKDKEHNKVIEEGNKLLQYLDDLDAGKLTLKNGSFRKGDYNLAPIDREEALSYIANSHIALGNLDEAAKLLQQAVLINQNPCVARNLAGILSESNKANEGIELCKKILIDNKGNCFNDDHAALIEGISVSLNKMGHTDQAEQLMALVDKAYQRKLSPAREALFDKAPEQLKARLNAGGRDFGKEVIDYVMTTLSSLNL